MNIRYRLEYIAVRIFYSVVKAMPKLMSIKIGRALGALSFYCIRKRLAIAHTNLDRAFSGTLSYGQRSAIIRRLLRMLGEALIESVIFSQQDIARNVTIEGSEHLDRAIKLHRGALILVPHFGIWELASHVFGSYLTNASVIYKALKNPYVDDFLVGLRKKSNLDLLPSRDALRLVLRNLRKGYAVGLLFDQNAGREGIPASFFGQTAFTHSAPAVFALKTGCTVLPAYMIEDAGFRKHRLVIGRPFPLISTGNKEADIMANTQQYNDFLEALVRRHPEKWFGWLHRRWKIPRTLAQEPENTDA